MRLNPKYVANFSQWATATPANSPLVETVTFKSKRHDAADDDQELDDLDRLTKISSVPAAGNTVSFKHQYNSAG